MKFKLKDLEIDIKVKKKGEKRASTEATMATLNSVCVYLFEASERYRQLNMPTLMKGAIEARDAIYDVLDAKGYYNDLEEG